MSSIKIYQSEIKDGLEETIKTQASVACYSDIKIKTCATESLREFTDNDTYEKVIAQNEGQKDLFYLESVLVSTNWNKNDDVFTPENTWAARTSPEDKQFNYMHDENDIIGHITHSYVMLRDGTVASVDVDTPAPQDFDIVTQAVLYNSWSGEENRERMEKIISEIGEGKWSVSMECLFTGFDYMIEKSEGNYELIERDESSSFLTKHLRSYGGSGQYEGNKIGRVLRNVSFSGVGLVATPANPRSIILNSKSEASSNDSVSVNLDNGDYVMSDILKVQLDEVRAELAAAKEQNEVLKAEIEANKDSAVAAEVDLLKTTIAEQETVLAEREEAIKATQVKVAEMEDALAAAKQELQKAMKEMDEMKKEKKKAKRYASLSEAGFEGEEIDSTLASLESLEDEAFEVIVAMMKKKAMMKKDAKKDEKKDEEKKEEASKEVEVTETIEEEVVAEDFETEETEATIVSEEVQEDQLARKSIAGWIEEEVLSKTK